MADNAPKATHPRVVHSFYLLSGLLYCSCGRAMIGRSAKSHQHYYYVCNTGYKQGKKACAARNLPKEQLENLIINQIKDKILSPANLKELVLLTNEALDSKNGTLKEKLNAIDNELRDLKSKLTRLYDILETGKLEDTDIARSKAFLRSFIKRITIAGKNVKIEYRLPLSDGRRIQTIEVLPIITSSGDRVTIGRTFSTTFALVY
jgi:hypothetical protein